jgi:hypothetical protein
MDVQASSKQTQEVLGWRPTQPGLIADISLQKWGADSVSGHRRLRLLRKRRHRIVRRWRLGSDITGGMPGTENAMGAPHGSTAIPRGKRLRSNTELVVTLNSPAVNDGRYETVCGSRQWLSVRGGYWRNQILNPGDSK